MDLAPTPALTGNLDTVLAALRGAGEPTRLRILAALDGGELAVSELCRILGQSQPRVSRHLRLLCEAGLLERHSEGTSALYGHVRAEPGRTMLLALLALLDPADPAVEADRQRLTAMKAERASAAIQYFERIAERWDRVRSLHVDDAEVEAALLATATIGTGDREGGRLLDIGTGTGRVLELFADRIEHGLGVDLSSSMLKAARAHLSERGLHHCSVRQANIYALDVPAGSIDLAVAHHVLHFLDDPGAALAEAALTLRPGGQLIVVDFAPHRLTGLRSEHAHRWLGFDDAEMAEWLGRAGLVDVSARHLVPPPQPAPPRPAADRAATASAATHLDTAPDLDSAAELLTVGLWSATKPDPVEPRTTTPPPPPTLPAPAGSDEKPGASP